MVSVVFILHSGNFVPYVETGMYRNVILAQFTGDR